MPAINKKLVLKDKLKVFIKGDAYIKLHESDLNEIDISHNESLDDFECIFGDGSVSITDKTKNNHAPKKFSDSGILFNILMAINKIQSNINSGKKINIAIGLKKDADLDFLIDCDNLNMEILSAKIGKITINSANLALSTNNDFSSSSIEIKSSNIKGDFWYSVFTKNISIKANNGKLLVRKIHGYGGAMNFSGNNLKIHGNNALGDPSLGLLKVKMNNGKVHLVEQQGVLGK